MPDKENPPIDEEYVELLPPTGDCTITPGMGPCIVYMLMDGTVTIAKGVDKKKVHVKALGKAVTVKEFKE